jgi:hypothetical protein
MIKNSKTTFSGLVLIAVGAFLIYQKGVSPDNIAIITAGAGLVMAADAPPKQQ